MRRVGLAVAIAIAIATPTIAHAWGPKGHKTVAELSLNYLTDAARTGVESLLGADESRYINASIWPDQIKNQRPETKPWHYVDIPVDAPGYDPARDCKNNNCVIARIDMFAKQLADKRTPKAKRVEALKFIIHFIGDIHQPLHGAEADDDGGGNKVWVKMGDLVDKLHSVWDSQLVDKLGSTPSDIAENLETRISDDDVKNWSKGTPKSWAEESHAIARDFIYAESRGKNDEDNPHILRADYTKDALPIVRSRISVAAVRLAMVLNKAFEPPKPAPRRR